jgi:hypothetical protein
VLYRSDWPSPGVKGIRPNAEAILKLEIPQEAKHKNSGKKLQATLQNPVLNSSWRKLKNGFTGEVYTNFKDYKTSRTYSKQTPPRCRGL